MLPPYQPRGRYFEDLEVGQEWLSAGRTITEADIVNFAGVSGDFNPFHVNEEFARTNVYGGRVAHGVLSLAIAVGLFVSNGPCEGTILGLVGIDARFTAPIRPGDTIRVNYCVAKLLPGEDPRMGVAIFNGEIYNQDGEKRVYGHIKALVLRRTPAEAAS